MCVEREREELFIGAEVEECVLCWLPMGRWFDQIWSRTAASRVVSRLTPCHAEECIHPSTPSRGIHEMPAKAIYSFLFPRSSYGFCSTWLYRPSEPDRPKKQNGRTKWRRGFFFREKTGHRSKRCVARWNGNQSWGMWRRIAIEWLILLVRRVTVLMLDK